MNHCAAMLARMICKLLLPLVFKAALDERDDLFMIDDLGPIQNFFFILFR